MHRLSDIRTFGDLGASRAWIYRGWDISQAPWPEVISDDAIIDPAALMVIPPTCPAYHHVLMVARIQHRAACDDLAGVLDLCDLQAAGGGPETVDAIVADAFCLADAAQIAAWVCRFRRLLKIAELGNRVLRKLEHSRGAGPGPGRPK